MKLLYITNGINGAGGLERVLSIKASYLAEVLGYEVHILSLNEPKPKPFYPFSPKVSFHSIAVAGNALHYLYAYQKGIKQTVKKLQPEVISVCDDGLKGFYLPLLLGKKRPILYERHASVQLNFSNRDVGKWKQKLTHKLMQRLAKNFDAFVVLSFYPVTTTISENKRVIAVGSHSFNKGYDLLLQAWKLVFAEFPDWKLYIYGKFDNEKTYIKLAEKLEIKNQVYFSQPVAQIADEYLKSNIMVLSSRSEGFGMVLIEAMACGLPCVSFDCPHGPADIIKDGEDGILVKNGDIQGLADGLIKLISDENLRKKMGATAKTNVQRFLPETILKQWDTLFKNLVKQRSS